jgi:methionyl-tRNA formyltransferase
MKKYIIASSKEWFYNTEKSSDFSKYDFIFLSKKEELTIARISKINPRYIFFPHWNWVVPSEIHEKYECICFHTAPLPFGRGGSPIQNLIIRNFDSAPVCALKMTEVLDGGPLYKKLDVSLLGGGDEIFIRISKVIEKLIIEIIQNEPIPIEQVGTVTYFKRRTPDQSKLPEDASMVDIFNHIRMLDANEYPLGYIEYGNLKIEFKNAVLRLNGIEANVFIKLNKE